MSASDSRQEPVAGAGRAAQTLVLALAVLLPLFPPETRGESMAGCAALLALLALVRWWWVAAGWGPAVLLLPLVLAWPLTLAAAAPGRLPEPLAIAVLAGAGGLAAASLPSGSRRGPALCWSLAAGGVAVALHAVYQALGGLELAARHVAAAEGLPGRAAVLERLGEGRAFASFATPAALGGFLVLALPPTVGLGLSRRGVARGAVLGAALVQVGGLLAAASATAIGGLGIALAGAAWRAVGSRRRLRLALAVAFAGLGLAGVVALRGPELLNATGPGGPWRLRAANMRAAWRMFADHPFLGVGPGGFGEVYPGYRRAGDNEVQHAHCLPLELAAETGVVGAVVLAPALIGLFLGPLLRRTEGTVPWVRGIEIGLAGFALQNLADFTAFFPSLVWLAALLRGAVAGSETSLGPGRSPAARLVSGAALAGTLLAALVAGRSGLAWNARFDSRQSAVAGAWEAAAGEARRATRLAPWDVDGWLILAQVLVEQPRERALEAATEAAERAVRLSPVRPQARRVRAAMRLRAGDLAGAYADLAEAARLYPLRPEYGRERDALGSRLEAAVARGAR